VVRNLTTDERAGSGVDASELRFRAFNDFAVMGESGFWIGLA
jgi:hypothetical protein